MRIINATIYEFIIRENSELMILDRSTDASYEMTIEGLMVAIEYIRQPDRAN